MAVFGVSQRWACRAVGQHQTTQRHIPVSATVDDPDKGLRDWLRQFAQAHPRQGWRKADHQARGEGWLVKSQEDSTLVA